MIIGACGRSIGGFTRDACTFYRNFAGVSRQRSLCAGGRKCYNGAWNKPCRIRRCAGRKRCGDERRGQIMADDSMYWDALHDRRILLVESHGFDAELVTLMLEKAGCCVSLAINGSIAREKFINAEKPFDAVLIALRMPAPDGFETARMIRSAERPEAAAVPIIALASTAYEEERARAREAGMNGCLVKPPDPRQLYRELARLL